MKRRTKSIRKKRSTFVPVYDDPKGKGKPVLSVLEEMYELPTQSIIQRLRAHLANLEPDLAVGKMSDQEVIDKLNEIVKEKK